MSLSDAIAAAGYAGRSAEYTITELAARLKLHTNPPANPVLANLAERLKRTPWYSGLNLDAFEVEALRTVLR